MDREETRSESPLVIPVARQLSAKGGCGLARQVAPGHSRLLAAAVAADKRWHASLVQLAAIQDQLRLIRREQQACEEGLRLLWLRGSPRAAREQAGALKRSRHGRLYLASDGMVTGWLGFASADALARVAWRLLELRRLELLHFRVHRLSRLVSPFVYSVAWPLHLARKGLGKRAR